MGFCQRFAATAAIFAVLSGCNSQSSSETTTTTPDDKVAASSGDPSTGSISEEAPPAEPAEVANPVQPTTYEQEQPAVEVKKTSPLGPGPAHIAKVLLSEEYQAMCAVGVGDRMPAIELPDLDGNPTTLASLLGEKASVVLFWTSESRMSQTELADLTPDIAAPTSGLGINVIGIHVGGSAEEAQKQIAYADATFTNLIDADGAAFALVGSQQLPRTFLLDPTGKILWFDIGYSRGTRRELKAGVRFVLENQ